MVQDKKTEFVIITSIKTMNNKLSFPLSFYVERKSEVHSICWCKTSTSCIRVTLYGNKSTILGLAPKTEFKETISSMQSKSQIKTCYST